MWVKLSNNMVTSVPTIVDSVNLYCVNNGAIVQAKKPMSHQLFKNVLRQFHLIKES
jgi:hypothetical protein